MSPSVKAAVCRYEHGEAWASALQFALWSGKAKLSLAEEVAAVLNLDRPLSDEERGFFDRLEEWLSA